MKKRIRVHIGEFHASKEPVVIETLLGSCVAVCLYDLQSRIGGLNHILLPGRADLRHFDTASRYGINAMELLINSVMKLGGIRRNLVAKVFGGANVMPTVFREDGMGSRNAEFVLEFLHTEAITVVSQDLGGHDTRKIYFHTDTGDVFLKRLSSSYYSRISLEERELLNAARKKARKAGEVTLFDTGEDSP
jgi:chemotaxis protein CheD